MRFELTDSDLEKIRKKVTDGTGFTWRERLAITFMLHVILWLTEGTSLRNVDISLLKNDLYKGLKINEK